MSQLGVVGSGISPLTPKSINAVLSAGGANMDDTGLKMYLKFNETSGDIINASQALASLGTDADLQVTGATYSDSTSPFGYGLSFDGVNDYAIVGTSKSQFNYMFQANAVQTVVAWVKYPSTQTSFGYTMNNGQIDANKIGIDMIIDAPAGATGVLRTLVRTANAAAYLSSASGSGDVDDDTWYMLVWIVDYSLGSPNAGPLYIDDGDKIDVGTLAGSVPSANATDAMTFAARSGINDRFTKMVIAEVSYWDRKLPESDIDLLYNGGSGLAIY